MRIYLGITGTGGKVLGSFEVGEIIGQCMKVKFDGEYKKLGGYTIGRMISRYIDLENCFKWGYTNQNYAIEIKDFREEDLTIDDLRKSSFNEAFIEFLQSNSEEWLSREWWNIKRLPQSFQYVETLLDANKAILIPIHQKWFDMIASGEKKYEFRNVLPKALRGGK